MSKNKQKSTEQSTALQTTDSFYAALAEVNKKKEVPAIGEDYLPQAILFYGTSDPITNGDIASEHWGARVNDELVDLGPEFRCIFLAYRSRAQATVGDDGDTQICFDPAHPFFKWVKTKADAAKSKADKVNYKYGLDVFAYAPEIGFFSIFFGRNKSLRFEARKKLKKWVSEPSPFQVTLGGRWAESNGTKFYAAEVNPTPEGEEVVLQDPEGAGLRALQEFKNTPNKLSEDIERAFEEAKKEKDEVVDAEFSVSR